MLAPLQALCQAIPAVQFQCPGRHLDRNSQSVPGQGAAERLPFQACKTRTIREQIPEPGDDIPPTWRWRYAVMTSTDTDGRCRIPKWWHSAARWKDGSSRCFSSISTPMSVSESHSRPPSATFRTASALMTTPGLMRLSAGSITGMDIGKRWRIPRF